MSEQRRTPRTDALAEKHVRGRESMFRQYAEMVEHARALEIEKQELAWALKDTVPMLESYCQGDPRAAFRVGEIKRVLTRHAAKSEGK